MGTIANINGANVTRLRVLQMGSNNTSCVLQTALIADGDTNKYVCSVENLVLSTDIPIFPRGTTVFIICFVEPEVNLPFSIQFEEVHPENKNSHYKCVVGPVYSFLDFVSQIQVFCDRYNKHTINNDSQGTITVDATLASKKQFGIRGNQAFWGHHVLYFPNEIGRLFDVAPTSLHGFENTYHMYLQDDFDDDDKNLWEINQYGTIVWRVDPRDYMYFDQIPGWDLGINATVSISLKMDIFENRVGLVVDATLPIPLQMFCINANKRDHNKGSSKYAFLTLDFPEGKLTHKSFIKNSQVSDDFEMSQPLRTGLFRLISNSNNSVAKKMIPGQLQDHRYELLLIRKTTNSDGSVTIKEEPLVLSQADYWSMDIVFTKEV